MAFECNTFFSAFNFFSLFSFVALFFSSSSLFLSRRFFFRMHFVWRYRCIYLWIMCTIECAISANARARVYERSWREKKKIHYRTVAPICHGFGCVLLFNELQHWQRRWHFDILKDSGKQHAKCCCCHRHHHRRCVYRHCCYSWAHSFSFYRKMQVSECLLIWYICECQHARTHAHVSAFSKRKSFFLSSYTSHPNCQCCKLRICFGEKMRFSPMRYTTLFGFLFIFIVFVFIFFLFSNLTIPNIQFISWPDIVNT